MVVLSRIELEFHDYQSRVITIILQNYWCQRLVTIQPIWFFRPVLIHLSYIDIGVGLGDSNPYLMGGSQPCYH